MNKRVAMPSRASGIAGSSVRFKKNADAHTTRTITLIATPRVRLTVGHVQITSEGDTHGSLMHKANSTPPAAAAPFPDGTASGA